MNLILKAEVSSEVTLFRGLLHLPREFSPKLPGFDVLETFGFHNVLVRFLYSASLPLAGLMNRPLTNEERRTFVFEKKRGSTAHSKDFLSVP